ncbi:hypothetical protein F4780DRAFT_236088 [Xylariomycetidae sp. FL0641]|nr:hypothetical protein F4780DRAFT_236088 [Xylariomycetidae sp. FL0641]
MSRGHQADASREGTKRARRRRRRSENAKHRTWRRDRVQYTANGQSTDTKEKPYICRCGSAFSRRDLLTRHQRISHEAHDPASGSPDGPVSDESSHQAGAEPDLAANARAASASASSMGSSDRGPPQYLDSTGRDLSMSDHAAVSQSYHPVQTGQDFYDQGQPYAGYDHYSNFSGFSPDGAGLPPEWSPYMDQNSEHDMVDPALRGSLVDPSSPIAGDSFAGHAAYNPWMSAPQQWGH